MTLDPYRSLCADAPPVGTAPCASCGRAALTTFREDEPLCSDCFALDEIAAKDHALAGAWSAREETAQAQARRQAPVEVARCGAQPFGRGSGEIGSSDLVRSMAQERGDEIDAILCRRLLHTFYVLLGLIFITAAAAR